MNPGEDYRQLFDIHNVIEAIEGRYDGLINLRQIERTGVCVNELSARRIYTRERQHPLRAVDPRDPISPLDQASGNVPRATAEIEHVGSRRDVREEQDVKYSQSRTAILATPIFIVEPRK